VVAYSSTLAASTALNLSTSSATCASRISSYVDFPSTNVTSGTQSFTLLNSISSLTGGGDSNCGTYEGVTLLGTYVGDQSEEKEVPSCKKVFRAHVIDSSTPSL
jgi:hypothetical protein